MIVFAVLLARIDTCDTHTHLLYGAKWRSAPPHPIQELLGGLAFNHRVGDGCDVFRIGDSIEYRQDLTGGAGTEPAGDHAVNRCRGR